MRSLSPRAREFQDLSDEELRDLYKRLRLFTYKHYGWLRHNLTEGSDLDSLIQDAIADVFTGVRGAPPDLSLFTFLCQTIRSKASHLWEKEKKLHYVKEMPEIQSAATLEQLLSGLSTENSYSSQMSGGSDRQAMYNQLCEQILALVQDDSLLTSIVQLWIETPDLKPQEIADELSVPVRTLQKAQKRLRRKVKALKEAWTNG